MDIAGFIPLGPEGWDSTGLLCSEEEATHYATQLKDMVATIFPDAQFATAGQGTNQACLAVYVPDDQTDKVEAWMAEHWTDAIDTAERARANGEW